MNEIISTTVGGLRGPGLTEADRADLNAATAAANAAAAAVPPVLTLARTTARTGGGRQLYRLKKSLSNPLCQFLGIVLIGDSITWGMTVTGGADVAPYPRRGSLADARNNATSPTWVNLLHQYLGRDYYDDTSVSASTWPAATAAAVAAGRPASDAGVAIFRYGKTVNLFPQGGDFKTTNDNALPSRGAWTVSYNPSGYIGGYVTFTVDSSVDNGRLSFGPFTGYKFKMVFAALSDGARYELYENGVLKGTFSTQTGDTGLPVSFGNIREHDLGGFVRDAEISIKVVPGDNARRILRVEAIVIDRELRVTNQGVIGTDSIHWYNDLIRDAVQDGDSVAFIQLGTNDRYLAPTDYQVPVGAATLRRYLEAICVFLEGRGISPIMACANAAVTETGYFTMSEVRGSIASLADARGYDMIDHFQPTRALLAAGDTSWSPDGLHPGDTGHSEMFQQKRDAIEKSMGR